MIIFEQSLDIVLSALVWSIPVAAILAATERLNRYANVWRTPASIHAANRGFLGLTLLAVLGLTAFFGFSVKSWQIAISLDATPVDGSALAFPPEATELSSLGYGLLAIWLIGAIAMGARLAISAMRSASLLARVTQAQQTYAEYEHVYLSDEVSEPVTVGIWRQAIVLPSSRMRTLHVNEVKAVLAHERAHIARFDAPKNLILQIVRCLFWFNWPLLSLIKSYERSREFECDRRAIDAGVEPADLSKALAKLAISQSDPSIGLALTGHYSDVALRMRELADPKAANWPSAAVTILVLGAMATLMLWTFAAMAYKGIDVGFACDVGSAPPAFQAMSGRSS